MIVHTGGPTQFPTTSPPPRPSPEPLLLGRADNGHAEHVAVGSQIVVSLDAGAYCGFEVSADSAPLTNNIGGPNPDLTDGRWVRLFNAVPQGPGSVTIFAWATSVCTNGCPGGMPDPTQGWTSTVTVMAP